MSGEGEKFFYQKFRIVLQVLQCAEEIFQFLWFYSKLFYGSFSFEK